MGQKGKGRSGGEREGEKSEGKRTAQKISLGGERWEGRNELLGKGREGTFLHHGLCLERTGGAPREGALCAKLAASRCGAVYVMRVGACVCVLQKGQSCCDVVCCGVLPVGVVGVL